MSIKLRAFKRLVVKLTIMYHVYIAYKVLLSSKMREECWLILRQFIILSIKSLDCLSMRPLVHVLILHFSRMVLIANFFFKREDLGL